MPVFRLVWSRQSSQSNSSPKRVNFCRTSPACGVTCRTSFAETIVGGLGAGF
jgi:hypothetical protein